jgi:hypothetical protein
MVIRPSEDAPRRCGEDLAATEEDYLFLNRAEAVGGHEQIKGASDSGPLGI